jgi:hypothetical protein
MFASEISILISRCSIFWHDRFFLACGQITYVGANLFANWKEYRSCKDYAWQDIDCEYGNSQDWLYR